MRRLATTSFFPVSNVADRAQTAPGQNSLQSNTTAAVLELDGPAPDSCWGLSEVPGVHCDSDTAEYLHFSRELSVREAAASPSDSSTTAHRQPLVGIWKLVSSEATVQEEGGPKVFSTKNPKGYLILTPWQRMMTVCIGGDGDRKKIPTTQADLSELWKTLLAYTGKYRVEGDEIVTSVDVSWYELWSGTEQRRRYELDGDKLTIVTIPQRFGSGRWANAAVSCRVVWEREN